MSKIDEFVKNWGFTEGFKGPKDSREQLRADFRRTVESLLPIECDDLIAALNKRTTISGANKILVRIVVAEYRSRILDALVSNSEGGC